MKHINGTSCFCSWSGGKDSCLALYHAIQQRGQPQCLLTMMTENGKRSRSHGLPMSILQQQADSLALPLLVRATSWNAYEHTFSTVLRECKGNGIECGVFGDIDIEEHRTWCERVCSNANMDAFHPLWKRSRRELLEEFLELGFQAIIVAVKDNVLDQALLGKTLSREIIADIEQAGADLSGEEGEYHTVVIDGPLFSFPIRISADKPILRDGYWFLNLSSANEGIMKQ